MPHIHDLYDFTVSAFVLHPSEPKICLHKHLKLNKWLQPGGHIELNEDPLQALEHELEEELGFLEEDYEIIAQPDQPKAGEGKVLPIPFHFEVHDFSDTHQHIDVEYLVKARTTVFKPAENESQEVEWFSIDEIKALYDKGLLFDSTRDITNWIAGKYF